MARSLSGSTGLKVQVTSDTAGFWGKAPDKEARDAGFTISVIFSCMEGLLFIQGLRMYLPSSREPGHSSSTLECLEMKVLIPELKIRT